MAKQGFIYTQKNRFGVVSMLGVIAPEELAREILDMVIGSFPFYTHNEDGKVAIVFSNDAKSEDKSLKEFEESWIHSEDFDVVTSDVDYVLNSCYEMRGQEIEDEDLVWSAREGDFDVDVTDVSDWVDVTLELPNHLTKDQTDNLLHVLQQFEGRCEFVCD